MRRVRLPGLDIETSALGFGCASLGSRVSARAGRSALARAYDAGVTWFDLAPAYGAGEAETIFADFLAGRRDRVQVLTKIGLAPPASAGALRAFYPVLRPLAGVLRSVPGSSLTRNEALPLTPSLIERSVARSLQRLRTDHVEVVALHDPDPASVARDDVLRALEQVLARGQAKAVGIAGLRGACLAGAARGLPYSVFQTAVDEKGRLPALLDHTLRPAAVIGHSVMRAADGRKAGPRLRDAVLANPNGVTLVSMFDAVHLAANLAAERDASAALAPLEVAS